MNKNVHTKKVFSFVFSYKYCNFASKKVVMLPPYTILLTYIWQEQLYKKHWQHGRLYNRSALQKLIQQCSEKKYIIPNPEGAGWYVVITPSV